ncbi:EAL domain-containing protein [Telluria aromaticivorans]|uniref:EAL domain-containing protein n=1 Tax=Telluria aromaticivorans TaxID=2725995 RepID=A0A7Y2NY54_9BURK|nr:EAL domain-containing protein [Telluria aromaticivorans]NNG21639.1 EAL domain-containing protein [Telluria aromaticivorans]
MTTPLGTLLLDHRLRAVFQPIVATADLSIVGYEALIRGPAGSDLESPAALFATARRENRQRELEYACLRTIWTAFRRLDLPGKLFVNVSASLLLAPDAAGPELEQVLVSLDVDPTRVVIEITEEQAVHDYPRLHEVTRRLSSLGYEMAIDDLGAGYASLRLWLELQPACVKLDNAFVQGSDGDVLKRCFLEAVQQLASCSQARVIAEGVETFQELDTLRRLGIAYAQGFYIARPSATPPLRINLS